MVWNLHILSKSIKDSYTFTNHIIYDTTFILRLETKKLPSSV